MASTNRGTAAKPPFWEPPSQNLGTSLSAPAPSHDVQNGNGCYAHPIICYDFAVSLPRSHPRINSYETQCMVLLRHMTCTACTKLLLTSQWLSSSSSSSSYGC